MDSKGDTNSVVAQYLKEIWGADWPSANKDSDAKKKKQDQLNNLKEKLAAEEAKNKLTEENKKVKILKPQNEDPFYYWNM